MQINVRYTRTIEKSSAGYTTFILCVDQVLILIIIFFFIYKSSVCCADADDATAVAAQVFGIYQFFFICMHNNRD